MEYIVLENKYDNCASAWRNFADYVCEEELLADNEFVKFLDRADHLLKEYHAKLVVSEDDYLRVEAIEFASGKYKTMFLLRWS